jgi:hypothetical protein
MKTTPKHAPYETYKLHEYVNVVCINLCDKQFSRNLVKFDSSFVWSRSDTVKIRTNIKFVQPLPVLTFNAKFYWIPFNKIVK